MLYRVFIATLVSIFTNVLPSNSAARVCASVPFADTGDKVIRQLEESESAVDADDIIAHLDIAEFFASAFTARNAKLELRSRAMRDPNYYIQSGYNEGDYLGGPDKLSERLMA